MFVKNITFVVPTTHEDEFKKILSVQVDGISQWLESSQAYQIQEKIEHEASNIALQLTFASEYRMETFTSLILNTFIEDLQGGFSQQVLYFETHLKKIF